MTITATHIGTSTVQINNNWDPSSNATTLHSFDKFAQTIADAITGTANGAAGATSGITFTSASGITFQSSTGWTLADTFWGYTNITTTQQYSPIYTQVFKSPCADGNSTKNIIIRYNTVTQEILTTTCEKYTVATRVISNEAWTFYDCAPINYNLTYSDIVIMVNPRYLLIHSYVATQATLWAGVVECNREDALDVASSGYPDTSGSTGYPCWGWVSSVSWGIGSVTIDGRVFGSMTATGDSGPLWSMPRTGNSSIGAAAAVSYACDFGVETYPSPLGTAGDLKAINRYIEANVKFTKTSWSVNKLLMPIKPLHNFATTTTGVTNYGQIYGLKLLTTTGFNMNQVDISVDTDLNANLNGTTRRHWLLNTHQKTVTASCYKDSGYWSSDFYNLGAKAMRHVSIGSAVYVLAGTGRGTGVLYKINRFTGASELLTFTNNNKLVDLAYDGERYIYITRNALTAPLQRLDIADNSVVLSANGPSTGYGTIAINGNTVTVGDFLSPTTTNTVYRFNRQAFTGTVNAIAATTSNPNPGITGAGNGTASTYLYKLMVDFDGGILGSLLATRTLWRLPYDGAPATTAWMGTFTGVAGDYILLDAKTLVAYGVNGTSAAYVSVFYAYPGNTTTQVNVGSSGSSAINGSSGIFKYQGIIIGEYPLPDSITHVAMIQPNSSYNGTGIDASSCKLTTVITSSIFATISAVPDVFSTSARMYGSELMATTNLGLTIWTNLNGYHSAGSYITGPTNKLCQVAIPA